ncbi:MAG: LysR substrate-binding domain-containing protein [Pseudomonadales bacterium]
MFRLPSIQTLRIFECAARHASFTKAADELGISQGAVSQHIKTLEIRVGFSVFSRTGRAIALNSSGQALLESTVQNLGALQRTIEQERRRQHSDELIISVLPGFAIRWLFARLMSFNAAYPDIKLSLNTVAKPLDFELYHAHAAIAYAPLEQRAKSAEPLFEEYLFPVCSPAFAAQHKLTPPLENDTLTHLLTLPLLGDSSPTAADYSDTWNYWLACEGLSLSGAHIPCQTQSNMTLQLAELGHGIAMGRSSLVIDAIARDELIGLTEPVHRNPSQYFVQRNPHFQPPALELFISWLQQQCTAIDRP